MKSKYAILITLLACGILALSLRYLTPNPTAENEKSTAADIDPDMAETIFRYQFVHNASGQQTNAAAYFLALGDSDPDDAFINRFQGHHPPVRKQSQCSTKGMRVTDKQTGKLGLIFSINKIVMTGVDTAEASGGYYEGGLSASGNTYYLKRKNGKWFVEEDTMHWISQTIQNMSIDLYVLNCADSCYGIKRRSC